VPVVFGQKWRDAIPVLQLLCIAGVGHTFVTLNWSVLQARGQAGLLLRLNLFCTAVIFSAFVVGLNWGVTGVAAGYAVAKWLLILPDTWVTCRSLSLRLIPSLRASGAAVPLAVVAAGLASGLRSLLISGGVPASLRLVIVLGVGALAYLGLVSIAAPELVREVKGLRSLLARAPGVAPPAEGTA
jgi:O-antigen/teichoic acid export membrane protein